MAFEELPKPADYLIKTPDPTEAVRKNVELVVGLQQAQQSQQLHSLQIQQMRNTQNRQQMLNNDMAALGSNPTTLDIARLSGKYPELKDHFKATFDMLSTTEKNTSVSLGQKVYNALNTGAPDIAASTASDAARAFRAANQPDKADAMDSIAKQAVSNPGGAKFAIGTFLSHAMGSEEFQKMMLTPDEARAKKAAADKGEVDAGLERSKVGSEIFQATGAGQLSRAGAAKDRQEISLNDQLNPAKIADSHLASSIKAIEATQALPRALATTQELQGKAQQAQVAGDFAKALAEAGVSKAKSDAIVAKYTAKYAPDTQQAASESAVAGATTAKANAATSIENAGENLKQNRLKTDQMRFDLNNLPTAIAAKAGESNEVAHNANVAANRVHSLREQLRALPAGPLSSGAPARVMDYIKGWTGTEGEYQKVYSLYKQAIGDKDLENASSHGAAAIIKLKQTEFPSPYADRKLLEPILADLEEAYLQKADAKNIETDYISKNRNTGTATRDFVAGNRIVKAGDKLRDIIDRPLPPREKMEEARQLKKKHPEHAKALDDFYAQKWGVSLNG